MKSPRIRCYVFGCAVDDTIWYFCRFCGAKVYDYDFIQKEWEKDSVITWGPEDISSSLCAACFKEVVGPLIHNKQLREGNFDCFGTANDYCDQGACRYRNLCVR